MTTGRILPDTLRAIAASPGLLATGGAALTREQAGLAAPEALAIALNAIAARLDRTGTPERPVPVLYLDLDSTVRKGYGELGRWVNGPQDVEVFPEAVTMMRHWKATKGGRIAAVSNQGGIALGHVSLDQVAAAMMETHRQCGQLFDRILWCRHHPDAIDPEYARCWCRKPSAGAIAEAANGLAELYPGEYYPPYLGLMVGDRPEDQECAQAAGLDFTWAADWRAQAASKES